MAGRVHAGEMGPSCQSLHYVANSKRRPSTLVCMKEISIATEPVWSSSAVRRHRIGRWLCFAPKLRQCQATNKTVFTCCQVICHIFIIGIKLWKSSRILVILGTLGMRVKVECDNARSTLICMVARFTLCLVHTPWPNAGTESEK
jgi:hypothetical protein